MGDGNLSYKKSNVVKCGDLPPGRLRSLLGQLSPSRRGGEEGRKVGRTMANADPAEEDLLVAKPEDVLALVAARTKLERSIAARDQLTEQCALLRDKLTQQADEQAEIFAYLNSELQQKSRALVDLETQVAALGERVREGQEKFDKELIAEKSQAREATIKLATEVGKYEQELGDLNIFISRKQELEGELEDTKTELLRERKRHEQTIAELERKTVSAALANRGPNIFSSLSPAILCRCRAFGPPLLKDPEWFGSRCKRRTDCGRTWRRRFGTPKKVS